MAISMRGRNKIETSVKSDRVSKKELLVKDFIELHTDFVRDKVLENLASKTIKDHKNIFKFLVKWIDESHWSDKNQYVTKSLFLDYNEYMMFEKNYAPCTVNVKLRPIKAYINWLLKNEHLNTNFNNYIKLVKVAEDRVYPLTKSEINKLINAIGNYSYARFRDLTISICILDCGIRIGELLQLTYPDVSFSKSYIIVRAEVSKTRTERILPVSRKTLSFLEQLKDITIEQSRTHLFLSTTEEKVIAESDVFTNFRKYKKEANINKKCTPYVLRHTFATEMVKKGVDIFTLQRMMEHKNITTTRQYVYLNDDDILNKHKEVDILSSFLK
ncbi:site-specific integrase [Alkaliphilus sp. MSJ-5]|uniref:Site-specific integrase n=1 Tax=Alkaliphilus flagellatus TaxID=2841507 RepID=A0ABS6G5N7_9FIRM|nr:site-specific integrase [Alkaliphilus flagellatus]MBU5677799.1 site-specific integrase [Alkaliphilus flagellatus]